MVEPFLFRQAGVGCARRGLEHHQPQRHMDLGGGQAGAVGVDHGFDHVIDQTADFRRSGVGDRGGELSQNGMAHAGDFQDAMGRNMGRGQGPVKGAKSVNSCR